MATTVSEHESLESSISLAPPKPDDPMKAIFAERFASVIGEEMMKQAVQDLPRFDPGPPADNRPPYLVKASQIAHYEHLVSAGAEAPHSPYFDMNTAPYGVPAPYIHHGGNPPATQKTFTTPDGFLRIVTGIDDDSSQTDTIAYVETTIQPVFAQGIIRVSPFVTCMDWHPMNALGGGGAHSDGYVGVLLRSSNANGSDLFDEGYAEIRVWDSRVGGVFGGSAGSGFDSGPDDHGYYPPGALMVQAPLRAQRRYYAFVYIKSSSDADGGHTFYASHAAVLFDAQVGGFWIDEFEL